MTFALQMVAEGLGFPEGPVAAEDGSLLFVDIKAGTLRRLPAGAKEASLVAELGGGPNGLAIGPDGAAYVCNNGGAYGFMTIPAPGSKPGDPLITVPAPGLPATYDKGSIQRVDLTSGAVTTLYDSYIGQPLLAPDDIVFDSARGGFWFSDSGLSEPDVLRRGAVYFGTVDGKPLVRAATVSRPNGVGLSPDGKTLYVSDTDFGRLWACTIEGPGKLAPNPFNPLMAGTVVATLPGFQYLDSLKVEAGGSICVGTLFTGGITVFETDYTLLKDATISRVEVPDPFTTNLCFGGADMQDVWITASSTGTIYKGRWPRPGLKPAYSA